VTRSKLSWDDYNAINRLTNKSLCRGEEKELSNDEIDEINNYLRKAVTYLVPVEILLMRAREKFAARSR